MRGGLAVCVTLVSLACSSAAAQVELTGRVVDENEAPVGGVLVRVRPAQPGMSPEGETRSDPSGAFGFQLPTAGEYLVSAQREDYFELRDRKIKIEQNVFEITLVLSAVVEVFQSSTVTDTPSPVDLDQTNLEKRLTGNEIIAIPYPSDRSLRNGMKLMTGVLVDQRGQIHFDGAAESQVLYTLSGFNLSDPITGDFNARLSVEGVRALEFTGGRYSPEYGKGSAGHLEIKTESGTDELRYSATGFLPGIDANPGVYIGAWTPRFAVSGPIVKGRAWFSDMADGEYHQAFILGLPSGQNRTWTWAGSNLLHGQVNLTPTHILYADFLVNGNDQANYGLAPLNPVSTTVTQRSREFFGSVKDVSYFKNGVLLELGYGQNWEQLGTVPQGGEPYQITPYGHAGNYFVNSTQRARRGQFIANAYLPAFQFLGAHQIKVGVDADRLSYEANFNRSSYEFIGLENEIVSNTVFIGPEKSTLPNTEVSSYVVDSWRLREDLKLELGLREDWDQLVHHFALSPRVSVSYAPFASKSTRITAGFAVTRDATNLALFSQPLGQSAITTPYSGNVPAVPQEMTFINGHNLEVPLFTNWTAGVDRRLGKKVYASVNYLRRRGNNALAYLPTMNSAEALVYQLTNAETQSYQSVTIGGRWAIAGQYEMGTSYVRSSSTSNQVLPINVDQVLRFTNNSGVTQWNVPNRLLSWGYFPLPWKNWAIAYLLDFRDGFPFSLQDSAGTVVGVVDGQKLPSTFDLNLHVERIFHLWKYRFAVRVGLNNITDHSNYTAVNNVVGSSQFLQYFGPEGRHAVVRLRFFGHD